MRYSYISFLALAAPLVAHAAPTRFIGKRSANDVLVLQFANLLEQFESQFYQAGIAKFQDADFSAAGFTSPTLVSQQLTTIQSDESTHASVLEATLQSLASSTISGCSFNFGSALTDVPTMAATARIVEFLGVSAYLGGATLIDDPVLLDAAGSILAVEARHSTILNILSGTGTAVPQAFDIPFTPSEVLAVASPFISGCSVGIPANPSLSITNTGSVGVGTSLTFASSALNSSVDTSGFFCQMMVGGAPFSISLPFSQCVVPSGINGPVAIWITSDQNPLANNVRDRATDKQIAGPLIAMIDTSQDMLAQLARGASSTASSGVSSTTQTITPQEASSIIAGASSTSTASSSTSTSTGTPLNSSSSGPSVPSTPNLQTGPSADGKITVNGWSNLPGQTSSSSSSSSSGSSSSGGAVNGASSSSSTGGPILATGPSQDGHISVDGWTNLSPN